MMSSTTSAPVSSFLQRFPSTQAAWEWLIKSIKPNYTKERDDAQKERSDGKCAIVSSLRPEDALINPVFFLVHEETAERIVQTIQRKLIVINGDAENETDGTQELEYKSFIHKLPDGLAKPRQFGMFDFDIENHRPRFYLLPKTFDMSSFTVESLIKDRQLVDHEQWGFPPKCQYHPVLDEAVESHYQWFMRESLQASGLWTPDNYEAINRSCWTTLDAATDSLHDHTTWCDIKTIGCQIEKGSGSRKMIAKTQYLVTAHAVLTKPSQPAFPNMTLGPVNRFPLTTRMRPYAVFKRRTNAFVLKWLVQTDDGSPVFTLQRLDNTSAEVGDHETPLEDWPLEYVQLLQSDIFAGRIPPPSRNITVTCFRHPGFREKREMRAAMQSNERIATKHNVVTYADQPSASTSVMTIEEQAAELDSGAGSVTGQDDDEWKEEEADTGKQGKGKSASRKKPDQTVVVLPCEGDMGKVELEVELANAA